MSVFWLIKLVNAFVSTCISDKNEYKFKQLLLIEFHSYPIDWIRIVNNMVPDGFIPIN